MSDEDNNEANQEVDPADEGRFVARCRGLPWSTTVDEIKNFFSKCRFKDGKFLYWYIYFFMMIIIKSVSSHAYLCSR